MAKLQIRALCSPATGKDAAIGGDRIEAVTCAAVAPDAAAMALLADQVSGHIK